MDNFKLFDVLPNGVIIYKNKKIEYINQRLLDVLSIGNFSIKNSVDIIVKILNVADEEDLLLFFHNNDYFHTQNKIIQIECNSYEDYHIFSFMHVHEDISTQALSIDSSTTDHKNDIDEEISQHFKLNNIKNVVVLTFFKGIPIKNTGKIIRINSDSIDVVVDSKHNVSLLERDDVLLITNTKKGMAAIHGDIVGNSNNTFTIKNFYISNDDMHLRDGVRVKPDRKIVVNVEEKEFKAYDISTNGISLYISTIEEESILKDITSLKISFDEEELDLSVRYLKTISDNGKILKIIFTINTISDDTKKLNQYVVDKQNEILREIHEFQKKNIDVKLQ